MKKIFLCLLFISSTTLAGGYYQQQDSIEIQREIYNRVLNQCRYDLDVLSKNIEAANRQNDPDSYSYWVWQYNNAKQWCDAQLYCIQQTGRMCQ